MCESCFQNWFVKGYTILATQTGKRAGPLSKSPWVSSLVTGPYVSLSDVQVI